MEGRRRKAGKHEGKKGEREGPREIRKMENMKEREAERHVGKREGVREYETKGRRRRRRGKAGM